MRISIAWRAAFAVSVSVFSSWGDLLHIGTLEASSPQSLVDTITRFSERATFELSSLEVQGHLLQFLKVPTLDGLDSQASIRGYMLTDPKILTNAFDFVLLNEIPVLKGGPSVTRALANYYRNEEQVQGITCMANPLNERAPATLYCMVTNQRAWISVSYDAVRWAHVKGLINSNSPPARPAGEIAITLDPVLCKKAYPQDSKALFQAWSEPQGKEAAKPLQGVLTVSGLGLRLTAQVTPVAGSSWARMAKEDSAGVDRLMQYVPEHAFASLFAGAHFMAQEAVPTLQTGLFLADLPFLKERVVYLGPSKDNKGFVLVQIARLEAGTPLEKISALLDGASVGNQLILKRLPVRQEGAQTIGRFSFVEQTATGTVQRATGILEQGIEFVTPLMRRGVLEVMIRDDLLIWAVASEATIRAEMMSLPGSAAVNTVARRIQAQNTMLVGKPVAGLELSAVAMFRHLVSIMPGSKPEHVRLFPVNHNPVYGGVMVNDGGTVDIGGVLHPAEIAALLRVNRDGRELLQELLFMMMTLQLQHAPAKSEK